MPEYKIPKENKPKQKKEHKERIDPNQVVSAYSEEGEARKKKEEVSNHIFHVALIAMILLMGVALVLFFFWRGGVFGV